MAKTIKFNLVLDGKPVRTIEELQENFCIDDILKFYQKGILQKWLKVRGFDEYLKKVESIPENRSIIIELIKIFEIEKSDKEIKEAIYSLEFWEERKKELEEWDKKDHKIKEIISNYHKGYDDLKVKIIENKEDMAFMKIVTRAISDKYLEIFKLDAWFFFDSFKDKVPFIIYAVLMNEKLRDLFFEYEDIADTISQEFTLKTKSDKEEMFSLVQTLQSSWIGESKELAGNEKVINEPQRLNGILSYKGRTAGYWKDLEVDKTKVMVLSIPAGTFIRSANKPKEELSAQEVNGKFPILDGLLYKSNNSQSSIVYMVI